LPDVGVRSEDPDQQRVVASVLRRERPDLVLIPLCDDPHPDHASGGRLIERALYLAGVKGYATAAGERKWTFAQGLVYPGRRDVRPDVIVDVGETFEKKLDAVRAHRSQFFATAGAEPTPLNRPGFLDAVEARAVATGARIGVRYGEPFALVYPLAVRDLGFLKRGNNA
jgi:LmbE family N-acetylglucosaminyl deacetylase